jgi:hypothetical protein
MRLVYRFSGPITNKVIHSQVVGMLEALRLQGLEVDLGAWSGLGHALRHRADCRRAETELRARLGAPLRVRHTVDRWPTLDRWRKARELARAAGFQETVLQTRSHDLAALMARLRRERPGLRFVYELRGDLRAELDYQGGSAGGARGSAAERAMDQALHAADLVLCVSQALAERIGQRHGLSPERLHVTPCTADEARFRPDPEARRVRRAELGLGDEDLLLVYSGSLVKGWDAPALIREFLSRQLARTSHLHTLLLSPDREAAAHLVDALPAGRTHARCASHWDLQEWLCAGDAGLLLREPHPLNEVASPTKAAEMLLCGLPLLISPGVGDYSGWVVRAEAGWLVENVRESMPDWDALRGQDPWRIHRAALEAVARTPHARLLAERLLRL